MDMVTMTADSSTNINQGLSFAKTSNPHPREASFSSYLNGAEEAFVLQLAESHLHLGRKKSDYGEIDVFTAEKYFSEADEEGASKILSNSAPRCLNNKDDQSLKQKTRPETLSGRSESSWNSRSSLLYLTKSQQPLKEYNARRKSFLATLGCSCSCNDDESVDVDNNSGATKAKRALMGYSYMSHFIRSGSNLWLKEGRQRKQADKAKIVLNTQDDVRFPVPKQEANARERTPEVFGSPILTEEAKSISLVRQVTVLREAELETSKHCSGKYNDTESDASSDLFEIESISTNTNPYLTRQASDVMPDCITPREASIQWSNVTAGIADFSVMSDSEEWDMVSTKPSRSGRRPSILSGCKSLRAVCVAAEARRTTEKVSPKCSKGSRPWKL